MLFSVSTMSRESSITMTPPEPAIEPHAGERVEIHRDLFQRDLPILDFVTVRPPSALSPTSRRE